MSNKKDIQEMLLSMEFRSNYIQRAFKVYEKNYGHSYNVEVITEIIVRLQNKDRAKKNARANEGQSTEPSSPKLQSEQSPNSLTIQNDQSISPESIPNEDNKQQSQQLSICPSRIIAEIKEEMEEKSNWIELEEFPFKLHADNFVMVNKTEFVGFPHNYDTKKKKANLQKSDGLYKYNTNNNKWSLWYKYPINRKMTPQTFTMDVVTNKVYGHQVMGGKGIKDAIIIFDIKHNSLKMYFERAPKVTQQIGGGASQIIIKGNYHLIYGRNNNKHLVWNDNNKKFMAIHLWPQWKQGNNGHGLVHIKSKNQLLLFGGRRYLSESAGESQGKRTDSIWVYSIKTSKWMKLKQKLPYKCSNFGYVLSNDEKYMVLFGAQGQNIDIIHLTTMISMRSSIKMPEKKLYCYAILTPQNEIHLIQKQGKKHWKIKLEHILQSTADIHLSEAAEQQNDDPKWEMESDSHRLSEQKKEMPESKEENTSLHELCSKQIDELQTEINRLKDEILTQQQQNNILTKSEEELKQIKNTLFEEKMKTDQKYMRLQKLMDYKCWNVNDVYEWIINVDNCRYHKYSNVLRLNLEKENINGGCLEMMNEMDLHRIGIADFRDKKLLKKQIDGLIKNNKRKEDELPICTICYNDVMNYVVEPCHHLYCKQCTVQFKECPKCRTVIQSSFQVYA